MLIVKVLQRGAYLAAFFGKARPVSQAEADIFFVGVDAVGAQEGLRVGIAPAAQVEHRVARDEHLLHRHADLARELKAEGVSQGYSVDAAVYRFRGAFSVVIVV